MKLLSLIGLHLLLILQVLTDYLSLYCTELSLPFLSVCLLGCSLYSTIHLRNEQSKNLLAVWDLIVLKDRYSKGRQIHRLSWYGFKKNNSGSDVAYTDLTETSRYGEPTLEIEGEITVSRWNVSAP